MRHAALPKAYTIAANTRFNDDWVKIASAADLYSCP
jgi:hypothetical protein